MLNVILVDDEFWGLKHLEGILSRCEGFRVLDSLTDSSAALKAICELRPDVVFTDLRMPVMNGIELIDRARAAGVDARYIIVSAYSDFQVAQEAIRKDVFDYLLKPIDQRQMEAVIERLRAWFHDHGSQAEHISHEVPEKYEHCFCLSIDGDVSEKSLSEYLKKGLNQRFRLEIIPSGGKYGAVYALSTDAERLPEEYPAELGKVGISRCRESFDNVSEMIAEAEASRIGRFTFASNSHAAEAQAYIVMHYTESITLDELAQHLHFSKNYLCDLFRNACRTTIVSFLKQIRLNIACWHLCNTDADARVIARRLGFDNTAYFSKLFRSDIGMTPDEYRRHSRE